ncbi:hypothetical protein ACPUYX_16480 [Desulfosporosinus sp. SYSU MS00001]|uniref:hypothetical protein n=1 Tax=Desulfosporosinus sp. SYSU MS00001 TaxID=3416284 RepID=UPI003CFA2CA0
MKTISKQCVLEERLCTDCGECDRCDLDPSKLCDNCCQCIDTLEGDYAEIGIDDILINKEERSSGNRLRGKGINYTLKRR